MRAWDIIFIHFLDFGILSNCVQTVPCKSSAWNRFPWDAKARNVKRRPRAFWTWWKRPPPLVVWWSWWWWISLICMGESYWGACVRQHDLLYHRGHDTGWFREFGCLHRWQPASQPGRERELPARIIACPKTVTFTCTPKPRRMKCCSQISILED